MFAKKPGKHIVKLTVTVNLEALPAWLQSGEQTIPLVPFSQWRQHRSFAYPLFRLPAETDKDLYFHKKAVEFSHSCNAIVNLAEFFGDSVDIQAIVEAGSPDLELRLWRGQLSVGFCQRLILVAPLSELITIVSTGKTTHAGADDVTEQVIEVPIGFDGSQPNRFMSVYETIDVDSVGYSNQLVHFSMVPATDAVRS